MSNRYTIFFFRQNYINFDKFIVIGTCTSQLHVGKRSNSFAIVYRPISAKSRILSRVSQRNSPAITPSIGLSTRYVTFALQSSFFLHILFPCLFWLASYRAISRRSAAIPSESKRITNHYYPSIRPNWPRSVSSRKRFSQIDAWERVVTRRIRSFRQVFNQFDFLPINPGNLRRFDCAGRLFSTLRYLPSSLIRFDFPFETNGKQKITSDSFSSTVIRLDS